MSRKVPTRMELLYFMLKPPPEQVSAIILRCRALGINCAYGGTRLHVTLLPLGDASKIPLPTLSSIRDAAASIKAEPFPFRLDMLRGNALVAKRQVRTVFEFQRVLVQSLAHADLSLRFFRFRPHVSVEYGHGRNRCEAVAPIDWPIEEFYLIKSIHGIGHVELGRWRLIRRQLELPFPDDRRDAMRQPTRGLENLLAA